MSRKRIFNKAACTSSAKLARTDETSHFDDLPDDTVVHIMQLLERRHALTLGKANSRLAKIYSRSQQRLREGYPLWRFRQDEGNALSIRFNNERVCESVSLSAYPQENYASSSHTITFASLEGVPEFELITEELVAHFRNQKENRGMAHRKYWVCEVKVGTKLALAAQLLAQASRTLTICQCMNLQNETLACIPSTIESIQFGIALGFGIKRKLTEDAIIRFIERTPTLTDFKLKAPLDLSHKFFENSAIQNLWKIECENNGLADGLDDELLAKFVNCDLDLGSRLTSITWHGVRSALDAWKRREITSLNWRFCVLLFLSEEDKRPSAIWKELQLNVTNPNCEIQYVERPTKDASTSEGKSEPEALEVFLLDQTSYKTPLGFQRIRIIENKGPRLSSRREYWPV